MFKSWKKKASSTKSDSSEKRFSLLGSKSSQSPLSGNSPEIPSAAYSQDGTGYQRKVSQTSTLLTTPSVASLNSQASSVVDLGATSTQPSEELKKCFSSPGPERNGQTPHKDANGLNVSVKKETGVRSKEEKRESAPVQPEAPPTAASTDLQTSENMAFIYQLDNRVQKLQSQVKDMRQYFKGLLKRDTEELVTASIKIQALARGHLVRKEYRDYKFVKLRGRRLMQRPVTLSQLQKECSRVGGLAGQESGDTEQDLAAATIQRVWRGRMVRKRVGEYQRMRSAATRIQSLWRGYRLREANPRIMVKILQKRSKEQQKCIHRLTREVKTLQIQMDEEIMIQKEHADSLSYLHTEVRALKAEKAIAPKKSPTTLRKPRLSTGPPAVDVSKFVLQEDFAYLKAEIEYLHQRLEEISRNPVANNP